MCRSVRKRITGPHIHKQARCDGRRPCGQCADRQIECQSVRKSGEAKESTRAKCPHQRKRSQCKECGVSSICPHQRRRSRCKECVGAGGTAPVTGGAASGKEKMSLDDDEEEVGILRTKSFSSICHTTEPCGMCLIFELFCRRRCRASRRWRRRWSRPL